MIVIVGGEVFIDGHKTIDPEMIGYAILDYAESQEQTSEKIILQHPDEYLDLSELR